MALEKWLCGVGIEESESWRPLGDTRKHVKTILPKHRLSLEGVSAPDLMKHVQEALT